jgi:transposase
MHPGGVDRLSADVVRSHTEAALVQLGTLTAIADGIHAAIQPYWGEDSTTAAWFSGRTVCSRWTPASPSATPCAPRSPHEAGWKSSDPWTTSFVNADPSARGRLLGLAPGRSGACVRDWLAEQTPAFRAGVQMVVIDPSAPYASGIRAALPHAKIAVDKSPSPESGQPPHDPA